MPLSLRLTVRATPPSSSTFRLSFWRAEDTRLMALMRGARRGLALAALPGGTDFASAMCDPLMEVCVPNDDRRPSEVLERLRLGGEGLDHREQLRDLEQVADALRRDDQAQLSFL